MSMSRTVPATPSCRPCAQLAAAPADGHTLLFMSTSTLIAQALHPDDPFDLTTLTPVTEVAAGPLILTTRKSFPVNTLGDVIAYAKKDPHRLVFAAGGGTGSAAYLAAEVLKAKAGIDVALVAYKGGVPRSTISSTAISTWCSMP